MDNLKALFLKRINLTLDEREPITFEHLERILEQTALTLPFENLCVIEQRTKPICRESLVEKVLVNQEGGLCYELNSLLYYFLLEAGFAVRMTRGAVFDAKAGAFYNTGRTHVAILLDHQEKTYLLDTGFGGNLPLKPLPLSGEPVNSRTGEFRVTKKQTEYGDALFEMKLAHKDADWRIGYAFDSIVPVQVPTELTDIQSIISDHPESSFNKHPLLTRLTASGSVTLTDTSLTRWADGRMTKQALDESGYHHYLRQYFT